jgi:hypothetical protein
MKQLLKRHTVEKEIIFLRLSYITRVAQNNRCVDETT